MGMFLIFFSLDLNGTLKNSYFFERNTPGNCEELCCYCSFRAIDFLVRKNNKIIVSVFQLQTLVLNLQQHCVLQIKL